MILCTRSAALGKDEVGSARAVLMLGGTLSPRDAMKQRLLGGLERNVVQFELSTLCLRYSYAC